MELRTEVICFHGTTKQALATPSGSGHSAE